MRIVTFDIETANWMSDVGTSNPTDLTIALVCIHDSETGSYTSFLEPELPQLWNVFRGDMSLVGPRPHQPREVGAYAQYHRHVLAIKPGITGLAQISGRSDLSFEEEMRLDTYYVENWSFWLDVSIILRTIGVLFSKKGAY